MDDSMFLKSILEIGVAGGIAFYLLRETTASIKNLTSSVDRLAEKFEKLDGRVNFFEVELRDIKSQLAELRSYLIGRKDDFK